MKTIKISSSFVSIILLFLCVALIQESPKSWIKQPEVINWDVISYYAYLPATFIFNDIKLEQDESFEHGTFWPEKTPDGRNVVKVNLYQKSDGVESVDENGWKEIILKYSFKENKKLSSTIIYLWNSGAIPVYFDDMQIVKRQY